jgi:hypothetical protein
MDLNTLFTAPAGTPSPLRDAYEAVAEFVHVACTLHQEVARSQTDVNTFVPAACALAGERRKALACLAAAEIWFAANAPDAFAAFHAALEGVEPVNHACADVLAAHGMNATDHLGGGFRPCTAYPHHPGSRSDIRSFFSDWPEVNERQLLERMRQPTALAAARLTALQQAPVPGEGPSQDKVLLLTDRGEKPPDLQQNTAHRQTATPPPKPPERLSFDHQTQTVTLDGVPHKVADPKAFAVYSVIANACPQPVTQAVIRSKVKGCRGDKKVRQLIDSLPGPLRATVSSGPNGYWLDLSVPPRRRKVATTRVARKKGRT